MSRAKGKAKPDIAIEIRRLQKTQALLISIQHSALYDVDFNVADALAVVLALVDETLRGLDRVEVSHEKS